MKQKLSWKNILLVLSASIFIMLLPFLPQAWGQCIEDDSGDLDISSSCCTGYNSVIHKVRIQDAPNEVDAMGLEVINCSSNAQVNKADRLM